MQLQFIGSGSAFCLDNYQSNAVLTTPSGKKILIDCGGDVRFALRDAGISILDIDAIYVSHLHGDHIHGLECVGFTTKFNPNAEKPKLFISKDMVSALWNNALSGGMGSIQDEITKLSSFFDVHPVGKSGRFEFGGTDFQLVQVVHVFNGFAINPCYGLLFDLNGKMAFYSADTQSHPNEMKNWYAKADVVFHDCETSPFASGVHPHYSELLKLPEETRKKFWLYHYQDGATEAYDPVADGFKGFVAKGQIFD